MDLTSFLLSEQGELSLDAFTDSMLANLPQQAEGICSLDPVVPFQGQANKGPGVHKMRGSGGSYALAPSVAVISMLPPFELARSSVQQRSQRKRPFLLHLQTSGRRTKSCSRPLASPWDRSPGTP